LVGIVAFRLYSTWAQDEGERSSSRFGRFSLGGKSPRYQLNRRLDAVSLAPAGNRAPILQHIPSSEHLDLVLTVLRVSCRYACVPDSALCPSQNFAIRTTFFRSQAQLAIPGMRCAGCSLVTSSQSLGSSRNSAPVPR
jgi:hypothetical protein